MAAGAAAEASSGDAPAPLGPAPSAPASGRRALEAASSLASRGVLDDEYAYALLVALRRRFDDDDTRAEAIADDLVSRLLDACVVLGILGVAHLTVLAIFYLHRQLRRLAVRVREEGAEAVLPSRLLRAGQSVVSLVPQPLMLRLAKVSDLVADLAARYGGGAHIGTVPVLSLGALEPHSNETGTPVIRAVACGRAAVSWLSTRLGTLIHFPNVEVVLAVYWGAGILQAAAAVVSEHTYRASRRRPASLIVCACAAFSLIAHKPASSAAAPGIRLGPRHTAPASRSPRSPRRRARDSGVWTLPHPYTPRP